MAFTLQQGVLPFEQQDDADIDMASTPVLDQFHFPQLPSTNGDTPCHSFTCCPMWA
jgi:hypothetical protein